MSIHDDCHDVLLADRGHRSRYVRVAGDAVKMVAAALLFPAAWRFVGGER